MNDPWMINALCIAVSGAMAYHYRTDRLMLWLNSGAAVVNVIVVALYLLPGIG